VRNTYQSKARKSRKFEVVGGGELAVRLPLPLVEVWEELQARVEQLAGEAGLKIRLEEGMEETLTLHRLGVGTLLRRSLSTTNIIESCLSTVRQVARKVKRRQGGDHLARWTAAGLLEAEKKFHKVKGYRELGALHRRLNPGCRCQACQEHRQQEALLHSRAQVA